MTDNIVFIIFRYANIWVFQFYIQVHIVGISEYCSVMYKYEIFYVFSNSIQPICYIIILVYITQYIPLVQPEFKGGRGPYLLER